MSAGFNPRIAFGAVCTTMAKTAKLSAIDPGLTHVIRVSAADLPRIAGDLMPGDARAAEVAREFAPRLAGDPDAAGEALDRYVLDELFPPPPSVRPAWRDRKDCGDD